MSARANDPLPRWEEVEGTVEDSLGGPDPGMIAADAAEVQAAILAAIRPIFDRLTAAATYRGAKHGALTRALAEARAGQAAAEAREGELRAALKEVVEDSGVEFEDERVRYVSIQVDRRDFRECWPSLLATPAPPASDLLKVIMEMGEGDGETLYYAAELRRAIGLPAAPEGE